MPLLEEYLRAVERSLRCPVERRPALVEELRAVRASWNDAVPARRGASARRVADLLVRHPVVTESP